MENVTLVLGGARSGKSAYAECLLIGHATTTYIATGQAFDDEMRARIDTHRARRPAHWLTIEAPIELAGALACNTPVLVDCLTLWLTNLLLADADIPTCADALEQAIAVRGHPTVLVSNETGLGIVPADPLSRRFRDEAGLLNQRMARLADSVVFLAAGLPIDLRRGGGGAPPPPRQTQRVWIADPSEVQRQSPWSGREEVRHRKIALAGVIIKTEDRRTPLEFRQFLGDRRQRRAR